MIKKMLILFVCALYHFNLVQACSNLLKVGTCELSRTSGNAVFETKEGPLDIPRVLVADSAYDQTFKKIFSWDNTTNGITGAERIKSILNSIFYPDASPNGFKIRTVEQLPNESTRFDEKTSLGMLKFDVACRCSCWAEGQRHEVKIFDVEMQTAYEEGFTGRLFDYGSTLRSSNDHHPVVVLAFLNYNRSTPDSSSWLGLFYRDLSTGKPTQLVEGVVDTHCVDLAKKALLLSSGSAIVIGGKEISTVGREWLKLLSMRHWAKKEGNRYVIPKDGASDPAVNSAITILASVSESDLQKYMFQESSAFAMLSGAKADGALEQAQKTALVLIEMKMTNDQIQKATGLSVDQIEELRRE